MNSRRKRELHGTRPSFEFLENRRLLTADLNGDGRVDFDDFVALAAAFGDNVAEFGTEADIDGDGTVGFGDFTILSNTYGASVVELERVPYLEPTNSAMFHATIRSVEQWHELMATTNPERGPVPAPVAFEASMLLFVSLGETGLGRWVDIEWVTQSETRIDVGYREYLGGVQPPPGTHVSTSLVALDSSELPVHFVELATIALP